jgi:hypothetical protein
VESTTGDFIAVIKARDKNVENVTGLDIGVTAVELQNKKNSWVTASTKTSHVDVLTLSDAFEIAINTVATGDYKALRLTLQTTGSAEKNHNITSYTIPLGQLVVNKSFTVMPDDSLLFMFTMDVGKSVNVGKSSIVVKPQGTMSLLRNADINSKTANIVTVTGGDEVFSVEMTYEQLLPAGGPALILKNCNSSCTSSCSLKSSDCTTQCKNDVKTGCNLGDGDCRDRCDPYISPWQCRDSCEMSTTSECTHDLLALCASACASKDVQPCIDECNSACAG